MTDPLACPAGRYCADSGLTAGAQCHKGFYCPPASLLQCRCPVLTYQDEEGASGCKSCAKQAVPGTGQVACETKIAMSEDEQSLYSAIVVIFSIVAAASLCMLAALLRSRIAAQSSRTFHSGVCIYAASFVAYGVLKAVAVGGLMKPQSQQEQMRAEILLNCTFMIFFWLGFVGKMALIQLWMHLISRHSDEHAGAEGAAGAKQLFESARRTFNKLRLTAFAVCSLYSIGFTYLTASYFTASAQCSSQIAAASASDVCLVDGDGGLPHVCRSLVGTLSVFKYLEGVFSGVVAVGFTLYAFTFNGLVYAVLTNAKDLSKLQRAVVGNQILRFLLSP
jgi:hypothetical protein